MVEFLSFIVLFTAAVITAMYILGFLLGPFGYLEARSRIKRIAVEKFKEDYPKQLLLEARVIKESDRCIVMISYGKMEPPNKKYYVVYIPLEIAEELKDLTKHYPQMDR